MNSINITFDNPWLLLLLLPASAIVLIPFLLLPKNRKNTVKKILPVILHMCIIIALVLILSGFKIVRTSKNQTVMILADFSDSTSSVHQQILACSQEIIDIVKDTEAVGVIAFGDDSIYSIKTSDNSKKMEIFTVDSDATNLEAALEYAMRVMPADMSKRIIILSDGLETDGDAMNAAYHLYTQGVRVDAMYFDTTNIATSEMQINNFVAPEGGYVGEKAVFSIEITSNTDAAAELRLYEDNALLDTLEVNVAKGSNVINFETIPQNAGLHTYRVELDTEEDTIAKNNMSYAFLNIAGEASVLIISDTIANAKLLETLLLTENTVDTVTQQNAPKSIIELCNYDEVILLNVDNDKLPDGYDVLLEQYVSIFGRSLIAVGGSSTYMYGNMSGTAFETMLPVELSLKQENEGRSVALMLVLDCSMSMVNNGSNYLSLAKQGAIKCVNAMNDRDYVGIVSFNRKAYLDAPLTAATKNNKELLNRVISSINSSAGTYYTQALYAAYDELMTSNADVRHIIFLSDGEPSDTGYYEAVEQMKQDGITVSTIGLGFSSSILSELAQIGDGRYYYVSDSSDLPDIMLSETSQVTVNSYITGSFLPIITVGSELTNNLTDSRGVLPPVYGYLGTTVKEDAVAYITTNDGHPIYARWQYGNGTVACFTSDLIGQWSSEWFTNPVGQRLILNMVKTTTDDVHHDSSLTYDITISGKTANITVYTAATDNNKTDSTLTVASSYSGATTTYTLTNTASGIYKGEIILNSPGIYELMIVQSEGENIIDYSTGAVSLPYHEEYNAFPDNQSGFLSNICTTTGGKLANDIKDLVNIKLPFERWVYNPLVLLGIITVILIIADIAVRRLKWSAIKNIFIRK